MSIPIRIEINFGAGKPGRVTPERLVRDLAAAVRALENEAGDGGDAAAIMPRTFAPSAAARKAMANLQHACSPPAAAADVPLPWPSAEVAAALDGLARLILNGRARGRSPSALVCALFTVHMVASSAVASALVLARHGELARALVGELCAFNGPWLSALANNAALPIIAAAALGPADVTAPAWRAQDSGANLRALTIAFAAALGAPRVFGMSAAHGDAAERFEGYVGFVLAAAVLACPAPDRDGLRASMLAQDGFAKALADRVAHGAAAVPERPGEFCLPQLPGTGALTLIAALCSDGALTMVRDAAKGSAQLIPCLEKQPPPRPGAPSGAMMDRLLAAAPDLLGYVAEVVNAGVIWYSAVTAVALLPDGLAHGGVRAGTAPLLSTFFRLEISLWAWALSVLELIPPQALAADAAGGGAAARLAPALLGLAEAARAVSEVAYGDDAEEVTDGLQPGEMALVAASAASLFESIARALGDRAAAALLERVGPAREALVRLSAVEAPAHAAGDPQSCEVSRFVFGAHFRVRFRATRALDFLTAGSAQLTRQLAAFLAASPTLAEDVGAAVGATPADRIYVEEEEDAAAAAAAAAQLAQRRALAGAVAVRLAAASGAAAGGGDASWLRALHK